MRLLLKVENDAADLDRIKAITDAGEMLVRALDLGKSRRDSLGYRAARDWSEKGMDLLTGLEWSPEYGALVGLVSRRIRGEKPKVDDARDVKRKALAT